MGRWCWTTSSVIYVNGRTLSNEATTLTDTRGEETFDSLYKLLMLTVCSLVSFVQFLLSLSKARKHTKIGSDRVL